MLPSTGPEKKPCVRWKTCQERLPTVEQLRAWDRKFDPERWGVVTGALAGIVIADFDGEQGVGLMRKWGIDPHLRSGSGGFHFYVLHPGWRVPALNATSGTVHADGHDIRDHAAVVQRDVDDVRAEQ